MVGGRKSSSKWSEEKPENNNPKKDEGTSELLGNIFGNDDNIENYTTPWANWDESNLPGDIRTSDVMILLQILLF